MPEVGFCPLLEDTQSVNHYVLLDFGSTFTKLSVVDRGLGAIVHTDRFPSTVRTDAMICLGQCFDSARAVIGGEAFDRALKLSTSSAAGGLRMAVIGLSKTLSITAARNAAFGAGAKIVGSFVGELTPDDVRGLEGMDVEIILFCGGYENGSTKSLEHNAAMLAESGVSAPIIFAGNSKMDKVVRSILVNRNKTCYVVANIIPNVGSLDAKPTEEIIRHVFMASIINMKGLAKVQGVLDGPIVPTPAAVLSAGELLSMGASEHEGMGPLMIVDVGGATTDIHSYVDQMPHEGARLMGTPEPFTRRTVEGDMGMRESSISLAEEIGWEVMAEKVGTDVNTLRDSVRRRVKTTNFVPETDLEKKIDHEIAAGAVHVSARRHSGRIRYIHASNHKAVQVGKNVSGVASVIGTGGPLVNSENPGAILRNVCRIAAKETEVLLPDSVDLYLDRKYVFYAAGLLRPHDDNLAFTIMMDSMIRI